MKVEVCFFSGRTSGGSTDPTEICVELLQYLRGQLPEHEISYEIHGDIKIIMAKTSSDLKDSLCLGNRIKALLGTKEVTVAQILIEGKSPDIILWELIRFAMKARDELNATQDWIKDERIARPHRILDKALQLKF